MGSDFLEYEKALQSYFQTANLQPMPLNSWDFYGNYFNAVRNDLSDAYNLNNISLSNRWKGNWNFSEVLQEKVIVVTDIALNIVFASHNILEMTGYLPEEVIGKNPKIFQGEATSQEALDDIRIAIKERKPFKKTLLNYKKNGDAYLCQIEAYPIFNSKKQLTNFIAFENAA